jgi:protein SCO1
VTALVASGCSQEQQVDFTGRVVDPPFEVADTTLETTDGQPFTLATDADKPLTLLFFGYTSCPDICPQVLNSLASGLLKLDEEQRSEVDVVFVSTDPKKDTPAVIDDYLGNFDPSFTGLTGDLDAVNQLGESVGVYVDDGEALPGGGYDPNAHGTYVIAVDQDGEAPAIWGRETSPSQFADDIGFLLTGEVRQG